MERILCQIEKVNIEEEARAVDENGRKLETKAAPDARQQRTARQ